MLEDDLEWGGSGRSLQAEREEQSSGVYEMLWHTTGAPGDGGVEWLRYSFTPDVVR